MKKRSKEKLYQDWQNAIARLKNLKSQAEIQDKLDNLDNLSKNSFLEESEYNHAYRQIFFDIPDPDLRREAIKAEMECTRACRLFHQGELSEQEDELSKISIYKRHPNEIKYGIGVVATCVALVFLGKAIGGITGEIIGAALSVLWGMVVIQRAVLELPGIEKFLEESISEGRKFIAVLGKGNFQMSEIE